MRRRGQQRAVCHYRMRGVNLRGAQLDQAIFVGADMTDLRAAGSNMQQCILHNAICVKTDLRDADLTYADFSDADLTNADLSGAGAAVGQASSGQ